MWSIPIYNACSELGPTHSTFLVSELILQVGLVYITWTVLCFAPSDSKKSCSSPTLKTIERLIMTMIIITEVAIPLENNVYRKKMMKN